MYILRFELFLILHYLIGEAAVKLLKDGVCWVGDAFGSYGWSRESPKLLADYLTKARIKVIKDRLKMKYMPEFPFCLGVVIPFDLFSINGIISYN